MSSNGEFGKRPCPDGRLSKPSVGRLSLYLRRLEELLLEDVQRISSSALGEALSIPDTQVRKDLASLGSGLGQPGLGYDVREVVRVIRATLGIDRPWNAVMVGIGNLARALLHYNGFLERGFRIVALFDADPTKWGQLVAGLQIHPLERLPDIVQETEAELGILTVPASVVQNVAEIVVASGIRGLLNFAPGVIRLPTLVEGVSIVNVDLTVQLEQLAFLVHLSRTGTIRSQTLTR
jgi:redox-sensing transcriptional repressor